MPAEIMESIRCDRCYMVFGMPAATVAAFRKSGESFHCPSGHLLSYGPNKLDRVTTTLNETRDYLKRVNRCGDVLRRSNAALRGVITRMRKQGKDA